MGSVKTWTPNSFWSNATAKKFLSEVTIALTWFEITSKKQGRDLQGTKYVLNAKYYNTPYINLVR